MNLIEVQPVKFSFFEKPPASSMNQAFVYENAEHNYEVVKNGDRLSRSDLRAGKYTKVYIVDMSIQNFKDVSEYPSLDRGRSFQIDLSIDYKVIDPISLVQQGAGEIVTFIKKKLPYWLEEITVDYSIEDIKRVKKHIEDLHEHSSMVTGLKQVGIVVSDINVLVKQSSSDQEHDKMFREVDKDRELRRYMQEYELEDARFIASQIQDEIKSGNLFNALLIAEKNEAAADIIKNRIANEERFRMEVQEQVRTMLLDPTVDEVEARRQLTKMNMYFPVER
ncbi:MULTISPECIES: hypothetical protein [Bacillaceae]|uniref:hypothetical protein n=1 Tax=Bacillaceae TaxID=186817 RepID=UPI000BFB2A0B|nr:MULTISPECIES: hypothetical protein [Bacillaceae]PGT89001.1 hypothetical protein COD11_04820 [Bacillus sp. AFS040349]UGB30625.1 hypothetical protein LPC09_23495 [Metabacillus sp. B2-18]